MKQLVQLLITMVISTYGQAQVNVKMKLFVVNGNYSIALNKKHEVKKYADLKIKLKNRDLDFVSRDFLNYLSDSSKIAQNPDKIRNYKFKLVIKYNFFVRRVVYFTANGDYSYKGKYYKKDKLFEFVKNYFTPLNLGY